MKKSLLLFFAALLPLVTNAHDFEVDGIYYNITSEADKTAEVTYKGDDPYQGGWYSGSITIPATVTHNGVEYSVTSIGERAFFWCSSLTAITIPEGVTSIGEWAFYKCSSLTDIVVAEGNQTYDSRGGCNAIIETSSNTLIQGCSATIIPESVTSIGGRAFSGCSSLTAITIPEGVTSIGEGAFDGCSSLTAITIPEGVTSIGSSAFEGCRSLTDITIPASVTSIGVGAFSDCSSLTAIIVEEGNEVYDSRNGCNAIIETNSNTLIQGCSTTIIPEGVTSIGDDAFRNCESLTDITIPKGVTSIGSYAFAYCRSLTAITLPASVTSIGVYAFQGCESLTAITIPEGVTSIGGFAFRYCSSLAAITIPEGVTSIGEGAFYGCRSLTAINIPEGVTSIGDNAFWGCSGLTAITIPKGVTSIGSCAFAHCSSLTAIIVEEGNEVYDSRNGCNAIIETNSNTLIQGCSTTIIPASVTRIGSSAFDGCSSLTAITIPEGVTSIGSSAFDGCSSLTAINIPEGVTSIYSVTFFGCSSLTSITIPEGVTSIEHWAFAHCSSLTSITCKAVTPPTCSSDAFYGVDKSTPVYVPATSVKVYKTAEYWSDFSNILPISTDGQPSTIKVDGIWYYIIPKDKTAEVVRNPNNTPSYSGEITIPSKITYEDVEYDVTSIGEYAFANCENLTSVVMPKGITAIKNYAFQYCYGLTSVNIPEGAESIGRRTFYDCKNLQSITIPPSVKSMEWEAFFGCGIKDVYISDLTAWCNIEFGEEIAANPLVHGVNLHLNGKLVTDLTIPQDITSIKHTTFIGCKSITKATIPESVTSIGYDAFYRCSSLKSVVLTKNIRSIESNAFGDCSGLLNVYCHATSVPSAAGNAFNGSAPEYVTLHVPENAINDYKITEPWSRFGKIVALGTSVTSITLSQSTATLTQGEELTLTATITPDDAEIKNISWSSSNPSVATVDGQGKVTAQAPGTAIITATATDGSGASASCKVEVVAAQQYSYTITFLVDGKVYHQESLEYGSSIVAPEAPTKEGYTFSGWSNVPETMPASNVTITGTFTANKYVVTVTVDGKVVSSYTTEYGSAIVVPEPPFKEGYTFSGWSEVDETMPAGDVTITGSFTINKYVVTFKVDDEVIASDSLEYNTAIIAPEVPEREGHTFSGWGEVAETVPAHDVTYEGSFSVNSYLLTYMVDGEIYLQTTVEYGSAIVAPEAPTKEGHTFGGWSEMPETMPAGDVTITGSFTINKYVVTFKVGDEVIVSDSLEYNTAIIIPEAPEREGHTFSGWGEVAETVPAYDVTYEGSFSVNSYLLTYMVDGEIYLQTTVEYGSAIVAPEAPTKEGHTFGGWSEMPETMPAGDVTVTGTFTAEEQPETEIIASGTCGDSLTWALTEEYELVIEGTGAMYDYSTNNVPWGDYRKSIQAVSLSEEMTSIGDYAFSNCTKLAAIAIPESVTSIGYRAFYRCSKLATVTITEESQLTSIGYAAFESCSKLTDITIPCGVTSIGEYAFFSCKKLASITCYAATPPTIGGVSTFYSMDKTIPVYVLDYAVAAYQSAKHWSEFTWFIGMETGINNSEIKNQKSDIIYDFHGRRITDTEGLKGIYIVNGRKVIIK